MHWAFIVQLHTKHSSLESHSDFMHKASVVYTVAVYCAQERVMWLSKSLLSIPPQIGPLASLYNYTETKVYCNWMPSRIANLPSPSLGESLSSRFRRSFSFVLIFSSLLDTNKWSKDNAKPTADNDGLFFAYRQKSNDNIPPSIWDKNLLVSIPKINTWNVFCLTPIIWP